ncbi:MAG: terminase family protein [Clostridium sp.]|nr:terminase family protein [Clostridium sp.]
MPIDWTKSKYSKKHRQFLSLRPEDMKFFTLCDGAVRSAKTLSIIYKIPQIFNFIGNEYLKVFSGYSKNTVRNNVLVELLPYLKNYHGAQIKFNSASGELDIKLWGKLYNCLVVGGGKSDSDSNIQGATWDFWYANELPKHHYGFYNMALSRLTPENARAIADSNPESSNHWLYTERIKPYLENDKNIRSIFDYRHFTMEDNANLSKAFIENQKKLYTGVFEARKIKGLWVVAEGLVYDTFSVKKHTCSHKQVLEKINNSEFIDFFLGLDWGWRHPLSCGLYAVTKEKKYYKIDELFGSKLCEDDVTGWILKKQEEYGRYFRFINADNARPEQNHKLRRSLNGITVFEEKPKVIDSIAIVRSIINYDRLIINKDRCKNTLREFGTYRYPNEDERENRILDSDMPLKENDDSMDETRYALNFYETHYFT